MGYNNLFDLASETNIETAVSWHLKANCYPPVPDVMIPICVQAIDHAFCEEGSQYIDLPEGVLYKGDTSAPAWAIVENYRLHAIIDSWNEADD
jgi:hypothetical protein